MLFRKLAMWFRKWDVNDDEKHGFQHSQCVVSKWHVGLYVKSKLTNMELKLLLQLLLCGFDICLFLFFTGQLTLIRQKFQLARVVLVVSNPHVFNLTRQLESKPPEFPTWAATEHKCLTIGYVCNCNAKEITILFCKQIGWSPNTSYAKCRMGLREGKMEMAGNGFKSRPIFVS